MTDIQENVIIIDGREAQDYKKGNIKGSINIPVSDLFKEDKSIKEKERITKIFSDNGIDLSKKIICYS